MRNAAALAGRWRGAALVAAATLSMACHGEQAALDAVGREAASIGRLFWIFFGVCTAVFVVVLAVLAVALLRSPGQSDPEPDVPSEEMPRERRRVLVVSGAAGATAVILLVFLVLSVSTGRSIAAPAGPEVRKIEVTGHQWWWEVRYPGRTPVETVTTANEIHFPVGEPVLLELASRDVIHSFWAPNLHGKKDLIPGRVNRHVIRAEREGRFRGQCAEFCGLQHAHMAFTVVTESPEKFENWLEKQRGPAFEPADPAEEHGRQVFLSAPCQICHTIRGTGAHGRTGPDLTHIASRDTLAAGTLPNNAGHLAAWILDPQGVKPGNSMPPNTLPSGDLQDLLAYLGSLR
jgi:cytochrome c oxidase subunit 2